MGLNLVSIIDLNPDPCPNGNCRRLPLLLEQCLPHRNLSIRTARAYSDDAASSPHLIVLRPCSSFLDQNLTRFLKAKPPTASLFGLFCAGWEARNGFFHQLVRHLDDFLPCPFNNADLLVRLQRLFGHPRDSFIAQRAASIKQRFHLEMLIGESERFVEVIEKVPPIAASDVTVLILGETGTGKELFARAIHYTSARRDKPFVPVNCGALPDQLFENELFGHAKGAFTDASSVELGLLAVAEGGTLFLDEVDAMSMPAQVKLLRFLQDREYRPLGSSRTIVANVRVVAATNADLRRQVERKLFREDLYHRLHVLPLPVPPLRDRTGDIPLLANHLLTKHTGASANAYRFSPGALQKLTLYAWPGNVREMEGVIQRAVILHPPSILQARDLELSMPHEDVVLEAVNLQEAKNRAIVQFERTFLANLLSAHHGNVSHAAKAAGKERRSFQRLLHKHGLKGAEFRMA
jgi:DNA-binding NtrC family response regulator